MITTLDRVGPVPDGVAPAGPGADHPMRIVTRQVAFDPDGWTPDRARKVGELFDGLASEWHTRHYPGREAPLRDALARGFDGADDPGACLEIGSGDGNGTGVLVERFARVAALDLAREMLLRAPAVAPRIQADAACLPFADRSIGVAVLVNALLFPTEIDRVLAPTGRIVWVNSRGDQTPIHLPAADVVAAMEAATATGWDAIASQAGWGTWCVVWRSDGTDSSESP
ncbi:MAG: class I SAM-dependent methyltransferase [Acidimicrobiales bacterium]